MAALPELLARAYLDADKDVRQAAAEELAKASMAPTFLSDALQVVRAGDLPEEIRVAAATFLKNFVMKHWPPLEQYRLRQVEYFPPEMQQFIKDTLPAAVLQAPRGPIHNLLRTALSYTLDGFSEADWAVYLDVVQKQLATDDLNLVSGAVTLVYIVTSKYMMKRCRERPAMEAIIASSIARLYEITVQCVPLNTPEAFVLQKDILKIVHRAIFLDLPQVFMNTDVFSAWAEFAGAVLAVPVAPQEDGDKDSWRLLPVWKVKKWAARFIDIVFSTHATVINAKVYAKRNAFAEFFKSEWAARLMEPALAKMVEFEQGVYVSEPVLISCILIVTHSIPHAKTWAILKTQFEYLITRWLAVVLCYNEEDEELFQTEPEEFIRQRLDEEAGFQSVRSKAIGFLLDLANLELRGKAAIKLLAPFLYGLLEKNVPKPPDQQNLQEMDAAMVMLITISQSLARTKYRDHLQNMLETLIIPLVGSPHAFIRCRACAVVGCYFRTESIHRDMGKLFNKQCLNGCASVIAACLKDPTLPVRVQAASSLTMLLKPVRHGPESLHSEAIPIVAALLESMQTVCNEHLPSAIHHMVRLYADQLLPYTAELCKELADAWQRARHAPDTLDEQARMERDFAASSCLAVVGTMLHGFENEEALALIDLQLASLISMILEGHTDHVDQAAPLLYGCTSHHVSEPMWQVYSTVYAHFREYGPTFFGELVPCLYNYLTVDTAAFLANPDRPKQFFEICRSMWANDNVAIDDYLHAGKLMELMLLQAPGQVDEFHDAFIGLAVTRLFAEPDPRVERSCINILLAALFYNPLHFFSTLDSVPMEGEALSSRFFALWFSRMAVLKGLHNRKLSIQALCQLIRVDVAQLPAAAQQAWPLIIDHIIVLFRCLDAAYEAVASDDSDSSDGDGEEVYDDDDDDDEEVIVTGARGVVDLDGEEPNADGDIDQTDYEELANHAIATVQNTALEAGDPDGLAAYLLSPIDQVHDEHRLFRDSLAVAQQAQPANFAVLLGQDEERNSALQRLMQQATEDDRQELEQAQAGGS